MNFPGDAGVINECLTCSMIKMGSSVSYGDDSCPQCGANTTKTFIGWIHLTKPNYHFVQCTCSSILCVNISIQQAKFAYFKLITLYCTLQLTKQCQPFNFRKIKFEEVYSRSVNLSWYGKSHRKTSFCMWHNSTLIQNDSVKLTSTHKQKHINIWNVHIKKWHFVAFIHRLLLYLLKNLESRFDTIC